MSARYAIYFAPDRHSPWRQFGARWLGRDEHDSTPLAQPLLAGISQEELARVTQEPRRYGFHATLKAPFHLAAGHDEASLIRRMGRLVGTLKPLALGPLRSATLDASLGASLGAFVALIPESNPPALQALAAACVTDLDDLRAPMQEDERLRRSSKNLDERALELLRTYGYPHVMERFRFHLTLTGPVDDAVAQHVRNALAPALARLNAQAPLWLDRLCLFVEKTPGAAFHRVIDLKLQA